MIVQIDPAGWTQEQKNMTTAMVAKILHDNNITNDGIRVNLPDVIVLNNSADISGVITKPKIESEYSAWRTFTDSEIARINALRAARQADFDASPFVTTSYDQIDAAINNINNLAELKTFLKTMVKAIRYRFIDKIT